MPQQSSTVQAGQSYHNDISPTLRDLARQEGLSATNPNPQLSPLLPNTPDPVIDHGVLRLLLPDVMPPPILVFEGISFPGAGCNCSPPNVNGAAGMSQYVQVVEEAYQVFDKATGTSLLGPLTVSSLFSGFGGTCQNNGLGDGIVRYDRLANRWVISQMAGNPIPTDTCIAVSTTSDATGTWNRYAFHLGTNFSTESRLSVWPDGYYMSLLVFNSSGTVFLGPQPYAFDREKMLAGLPATFVTTGITIGPDEAPYLPADFDGSTLPPAGAPNSFVEFPAHGTYRVFHFHADFTTPANSTFTLFASPPAADFTSLCPGMPNCVPQLCPSMLNGHGNRVMYRLAYRNLGTSASPNESLVGNYTVASNGVAGIHWFELKNVTSGPVTVGQENTYQPDDTWRWLGSAAMDQVGNLAIGFSAASASLNPQTRYAGRLATDPPNTLAQGEAHLFDGTGCPMPGAWDDFSTLTIDPVDDCTFWYTNEYYATTGISWRTKVGNFKFDQCTSLVTPTPTPTPTGTPATPSPTTTPTNTPTPTSTPTVTPTASPSSTPAAQPLNLSTRLRVQTGDNVGIAGFIITGTNPKQIALRGIGPSLSQFGVPDPLPDPVLELHGPPGFTTIINDDWRNGSCACLGTGPCLPTLPPTNDLESAICATLESGTYTGIIRGKGGTTGAGLIELYDLDQAVPSKLANISTRAFVSTGSDIVIAGFILGGSTGQDNVIMRGIGPSLTELGVPDALTDPTLQLRDSNGEIITENNNWQDDPAQAAIISAAGLAPTNDLESGIAETLSPGMYTVLLAGQNNATGVGLVEVYDLGLPP